MTTDDPDGRPPGRDGAPVAGAGGSTGRSTIPEDARVLGGRYALGEVIGRGGMASVRVAQDRVLGRQVAIKLLRPDLAHDPEVLSRFRREARAVAALNHPAIVGVHDVGEDVQDPQDPPTPFLVMELVRGATVRDLLDRHRSPQTSTQTSSPSGSSRVHEEGSGAVRATDHREQPGVGVEMAVTITTGVLAALAYSHRAGIVHRDIKPANVMLTPEGQVKVMDFGIARAVADAASTATHTSAVLGTAQYLSPEQARGRPVDARADLYSTGALLYELLTGRPPFLGDSAISLAYQHVSEVPDPPSTHHPGLPGGLDRVVLRALAKEPDDRYPDADAFRRDLEDAARGLDAAPPAAVAAASTTAMPSAAAHEGPVPLEEPDDAGPGAGQGGRRAVVVLVALVGLALVALAAVLVPRLVGSDDGAAALRTVPSVVGQTREAAQAAVEQEGLVYAQTTARSDEVPAGRVVEQDPAGSTSAPAGSTVAVVVSSGPASIAVPDLAGRTEAQALRALQSAGLGLGDVERVPDPRVPEGSVVRTDPSAGSSIEPGDAVDLVLSDGTVELDDYTGLPQMVAREAIAGLGLESRLEFSESEQEENTVLDQRPGEGTVPQGSTVVLVVATPPPPVVTPTPAPTPTAPPTGPAPTAEPTPTDAPSTSGPPTEPLPTQTPTGTGTASG